MFKQISVFIFLLVSNHLIAQTQLGQPLKGDALGDTFGESIALSGNGNRVAIGANGSGNPAVNSGFVSIFEWAGEVWDQLGENIYGETAGDRSGQSIAISEDGNIVAIGAPFNGGETSGDRGHVRVYGWNGNSWQQLGKDIDDQGARFGQAVTLSSDGKKVAAGAHFSGTTGVYKGRVRVFEYINEEWIQMGDEIEGRTEMSQSGWAIDFSADGKRIAIGAPRANTDVDDVGEVRVLEFVNNQWVQVGSAINGSTEDDQLGFALSMSADGTRFVSGSPFAQSQHVQVFGFENGNWQPVGTFDTPPPGLTFEGWSVSMSGDGNKIVVGSPLEGNGTVRTYGLNGDSWIPIGNKIVGTKMASHAGRSITFSTDGKRIAFGAPLNGIGYGAVYELDLISSSEELISKSIPTIFPIPTPGVFKIGGVEKFDVPIKILNSDGKEIAYLRRGKHVDISNKPTGIYWIFIQTSFGQSVVPILKMD